jgi:putative ABC transport system permease protein
MGREFVAIRLDEGNHTDIFSKVEKTVKRFFPKSSFEYKYVEKEMAKMHTRKMKYRWLALVFVSGFSLFIAAIGLFGFATFETERCTKEIGIRKALGAKPIQIALHFVMRFARLTMIANVLAWPVCYVTVKWILKLTYYPHPVNIRLADFLLAGLLTLVLTVTTVLIQTVRAARIDPVKALRYE